MRGGAGVLALLGAVCFGCNAPVAGDASVDAAADLGGDTTLDAPARCMADRDCMGSAAGPVCDTASGRCVGCNTAPDTCPAGRFCDPATRACVMGCASDTACAMATGDGGVETRRCDTVIHACVQCITDDHCTLGNVCRGSVCVVGCGATRPCPTGSQCCNGGCVDSQSNVANCGGCGAVCRAPNGVPACAMGVCGVARCNAPYADCDMMGANGCETDTSIAVAHCGRCGNACPMRPNAAVTCGGGMCGFTCNAGFADCDMDPSNGCEVELASALGHCGACGRACAPANATGACAMGVCSVAMCAANFSDCDMSAATGCEVDTRTNASHCARCGNACPVRPNAAATCAAGACGIRCNAGFADCDGMADNGCETDTRASTTNCGRCMNACGAGARCESGGCTTSMCAAGRADCDGMASNDCEVDTQTDLNHCGVCRNVCVAGPNATATCAAGRCGLTCARGFGDCDMNALNGCEINTNLSPTNCGRCGNTCPAGQVCLSGACVVPCPGTQVSCGGTCVDTETNLMHCGGCGMACPSGTMCLGGECRCSLGGSPTGGVQCGATCVDTRSSTTHCGRCGVACATGEVCATGLCRCNLPGGFLGQTCGGICVDTQSNVSNCGRCGTVCGAGEMCIRGRCACALGDGVAGTLCSGTCVDTRSSTTHCGACGMGCARGEMCISGRCACAPGTMTCGADICVDLNADTRHCGRCGMVCATGESCLGGRCINFGTGTFRIDSLAATGCSAVEHASVTGDDRGGIAVSRSRVFYTGDSTTARFNLDLSSPAGVGRQYDAITSELTSGTVLTFGSSATAPLPNGGGTATHLIEIDGDTGALTTRSVTLSRSIAMTSGSTGIFAGAGRIGVLAGGRAFVVLMPSGTVVDLGAMSVPTHTGCESWAFWGTMEFFGGTTYFDMVTNSTTISRVAVPTGATTTLATFSSLSDMCSFVVSASNSRWYWHHEGGSQFRSGDESIGYCDARFSTP
ncbi:MAG: hypothetical protein HY909_07995 [Deltaproteobacteria bacterium]|nr:hypothetical protein [Deltaproteobacteria bacterium]